MCLGKGLGGGVMPIGALLGQRARARAASTTCRPAAPGAGCRRPARPRWPPWMSCRRPGVLEHVRAMEAAARDLFAPLGRPLRGDRRRPRQGLSDRAGAGPGPRLPRPRPRDPGRARDRVPAPRAAGRLQHDLLQHPAVAGDAAGGPGAGRGDRRSDRWRHVLAPGTGSESRDARRGLPDQARRLRRPDDLRRDHDQLLPLPRAPGHRGHQPRPRAQRDQAAAPRADRRVRPRPVEVVAVPALPQAADPRQPRDLLRQPPAGDPQPLDRPRQHDPGGHDRDRSSR